MQLEEYDMEDLDKEIFISEYRTALFWNKTYKSVEEVRSLIWSILNWKKRKNNDKLVVFIKQCLNEWVPINKLTWEELFEAFEVQIPWIKVISDQMYLDENLLEVLEWKKFVKGQRMLLFTNWKMLYCDVSDCDDWLLLNSNSETIKAVKKFLKKAKWDINETPKKILESIVSKCRSFSND